MKKVMASLLTMGVFLSVSIAQTNPNLSRSAQPAQAAAPAGEHKMKHKTPDEWVAELDAVVTLTADQKIKAKTLAAETETKMKALRDEAKAGGDKEAIQQKRMQIHKEQKAALDKILNDGQKLKWKAHREEMRAKQGPPHKQHRTPDEQVNQIDAVVTLTPEQKAKVKTLAEAKEAKIKALREEQKASPNEEIFKQKRHEIGKEFRTELDKILTTEQKTKMKAHRETMKKQKGGGAPTR